MSPDPPGRAGTEVIPADEAGIERAAGLLRAGELVAFPTETVYGLGADATNEDSVASVFHAKGRPHGNPLIVHVEDVTAAHRWGRLDVAGGLAEQLATDFWPGPLTLVVPRAEPGVGPRLARGVSPTETVALRCPAHAVALELIHRSGVPVAAPSANRYGRVSATCPEHVLAELAGHIGYVLDGGSTPLGVESTVVSFHDEGDAGNGGHPSVRILRPGGVPLEDLRSVLPAGALSLEPPLLAEPERAISPGTSMSHYAPEVPVVFTAAGLATGMTEGLRARGIDAVELRLGSGTEAARGLYSALRALDDPPPGSRRPQAAVVAAVDPSGIGRAVNDRLLRAAHGHLQTDTGERTLESLLERLGRFGS